MARYHGPNGGSGDARGLAIDSAGNVYVTGGSEGAYATLAYDPNGNQLWVDRIPGQGSYAAAGNAIAVGPSGHIYAAGGDGHAYLTVAYDSTGNRLWSARYNGPGTPLNTATAIAVDGSDNVYVTGGSRNDAQTADADYATVAYDRNGNQLWVARYHHPDSDSNSASAIAVDTSGQHVYVTGSWRNTAATMIAFATVAYDASGSQRWNASYGESAYSNSIPHAIALDQAGNVYIAGGVGLAATLAYDPNGNQLWANRFEWAGGGSSGKAIAIDPLGNIVIGGVYGNYGGYYLAVSYDSAGNQSWYNMYAGPVTESEGEALVVDASGNVYVTGTSQTSIVPPPSDYTTVAYDVTGSFQLWEVRYPHSGDGDVPCCMAIDAAGSLYITGTSLTGPTSSDYLTIKYSQP